MVLESPALSRAVYYSTELDQEIPAGLYLAVAQVLAYVYQLRQYRAGKGKRPGPLPDLPIPADLRRDTSGAPCAALRHFWNASCDYPFKTHFRVKRLNGLG